ncbi:MAG: radical SAM protein [Bacteroidales bacterium]|nr:radical SAM protein [Bacteroidales bacterium]
MDTDRYCQVCIRHCKAGYSFCGRRDKNGLLINKYRFNAISFDYLFDKPVTHYRKNVKVLSLGSWGCNLRCLGCQNVNLSWNLNAETLGYRDMNPDEIVETALNNNCKGICYTFNEPAILTEVVAEVATAAKNKNLFNVLVTNSTLTVKSAEQISPCIDVVAADIKSMTDEFYYNYCGAVGIPDVSGRILQCIKTFFDNGCHIEVRTNIIPGGNDQEENYHEIARWIRYNLSHSTPWHITRFFPAHKLSHLDPTPEKSLLKAQETGLSEGLVNVHIYMDKGCDCARDSFLIKDTVHYCCHK